jgi:hypothetical protein
MKTSVARLSILFLIVLATIVSGCSDKCQVTNSYVYYEPVYKSLAQIKSEIGLQSPKELNSIGKIYYKDQKIYINEVAKGIHIIDNADPANPKPLHFLNIPGNFDLAILGNTLYADSYLDLVAFDISSLDQIKEVNRIENLFDHSSHLGFSYSTQQGILTDWKMVKNISVRENDCKRQIQPWGGYYYGNGIVIDDVVAFKANGSNTTLNAGANPGKGGSLARFTISNNRLYVLDNSFLEVVDISNQREMKQKGETQITWQAETLFPNNNNLFVGTQSGMIVFDLANPDSPVSISKLEHVRTCDPVVVEGDYAYVTLRNGNTCGGFTNQLDVINIKDIKKPVLQKTYLMTNPHGLGIDNGILFICDGADGLKIFDAKDVNKITDNKLAHYDKLTTSDIIPFQNVAMMIGEEGLYQYDYSDIKNIKLLSKLSIVK